MSKYFKLSSLLKNVYPILYEVPTFSVFLSSFLLPMTYTPIDTQPQKHGIAYLAI